ncbi:hypothetical protein LguiB_016992 [Lonicera macranthoides]
MEKEIEAKLQATTVKLLLSTCIYRSCPQCSYVLCLICCREIREGHLQGGEEEVIMNYVDEGAAYLHGDDEYNKISRKSQTLVKPPAFEWEVLENVSIPCPPETGGGCGQGILELTHIFPHDFVSELLVKVEAIAKAYKLEDKLETTVQKCSCFSLVHEIGIGNGKEKLRRAASREDSSDNYLYCPIAADIQPENLMHFQCHWFKGEPVIVSNVLETTYGLSWEPMVMWRALRQITNTKHSKLLDVNVLSCLDQSEYLGSIIQEDGEIEGDVNHRIQVGWLKWRKASGVLCDKKVPLKLKGKFYRTAVRPAMLYGTECWAVKSQHENKLNVAEMRMLRWMSGKNRKDKIRNVTIREGVGVAPITEKMVEFRLRWFGHVWRRPVDAVVRRVDHMEGSLVVRGRERPRKTIGETIKKDLEANGFTTDMIHDRPLWRRLIHVNMNIHHFLRGYLGGRFDSYGWPQILKLKEWPSSGLFEERLPRHGVEFLSCLPFKEYTHPHDGYLNLAAKLPARSLKPDMGPKMCIAYGVSQELGRGDSVTEIHYDMSDSVNVLMHNAAVTLDSLQLDKIEKLRKEHNAQDQIEFFENGDLNQMGKKQYHHHGAEIANSFEGFEQTEGGALWDIFRRQDVPKLEEYLKKHFREFRHIHCSPLQLWVLQALENPLSILPKTLEKEPFGLFKLKIVLKSDALTVIELINSKEEVVHPIHDQTFYLNTEHKRKLKDEYGIEPWTVVQKLGDAVFIPAGCPYQVRNLKAS